MTLRGTLYQLLIHLLLPIVFWVTGYKCRQAEKKQPKLKHCLAQKFGWGTQGFQKNGILIHAVSLGETRSILPLINELHTRYPQLPITLTNGSLRGASQIVNWLPSYLQHCLLPLDYPFSLRRFLKQLQPKLVVVVETEIWPNLIATCHQQHIPILLANARLKQSSLQAYQKWGGVWLSQLLNKLDLIACQFAIDQTHFEQLGVAPQRLKTLGNLKFDLEIPPGLVQFEAQWPAKNRFCWVAASTHEQEEDLMLQAHARLLEHCPDALLIIVPRQADRFEDVAKLLQNQQWRFSQRSQQGQPTENCQVFLADSVGEMMHWFQVCNLAFIGGSLVPFGGHNILEPAALAKPVISGRWHQNLQALYDTFIAEQAVEIVADVPQLAERLIHYARHPEAAQQQGQVAQKAYHKHAGALKALVAEIAQRLPKA